MLEDELINSLENLTSDLEQFQSSNLLKKASTTHMQSLTQQQPLALESERIRTRHQASFANDQPDNPSYAPETNQPALPPHDMPLFRTFTDSPTHYFTAQRNE